MDVSVESVNSTAVAIKWSPPLSPNGILLFYNIKYYGYKNSEVFSFYLSMFNNAYGYLKMQGDDVTTQEKEYLVPATSDNSAVLSGLQSGITYSFEVWTSIVNYCYSRNTKNHR